MPTARTTLLLIALALWCWLAMMLTHELGHVLAAWATGGRVVYVNLYPGQISSTLVSPNRAPGFVLWAGFASGWLVPQAIALASKKSPLAVPLQCWAGFCWLAGGVYLASGGLERLTDTGQLLLQGWPLWLLILTGVSAAAFGYSVCRSAWPAFLGGLSKNPPGTRTVGIAWLALLTWIVLQWVLAQWVASLTMR